jgi:hypothetical protein
MRVASPAMIVDGGVRPAEDHLLDEMLVKKNHAGSRVRFWWRRPLGQLFIR